MSFDDHLEERNLNRVRLNQILMHMGGERCRKSFLMKNSFCALRELDWMIQAGYLIEDDDMVVKTNKAKEIW